MAGINYTGEKDPTGTPKVIEGEGIYLWQEAVTFIEKRGEFKMGTLMLTTHHLFWYLPEERTKPALKIPLAYLGEKKTSGGWIASEKLDFALKNKDSHPPFVVHFFHEILKAPTPPVPSYPEEIRLDFTAGGREKFLAKLTEALAARYWEKFSTKKEEVSMVGSKFEGVGGIKKAIKDTTNQMASVITNSFADLGSLRDSAKKLVAIAEKIKTKLGQTEGGSMSQEMQELQGVMFDIGIGTPVTKEAAGKEYYTKLAQQFAQFVEEALKKSGGIMTLIDAYCLYNRARGTDSVSPEDIFIAATMFLKLKINVNLKQLKSRVWIFQSNVFNEKVQTNKMLDLIKENGPMSAEQIANKLGVNTFIVKENLTLAEEVGQICRDDSVEGFLYCENLFASMMAK